MAFTLKQHDNWPSLVLTLTDLNGPINLTTATTVKVILKLATPATTITGTCTITDVANGVVTYAWAAASTDVVGTYDGEVEITWSNGKIETVPNDGYFQVVIQPDLG